MDDNELIERYLSGDEKAFEKLYNRYKASVFSFILSMINDKEKANDIFQEVFITVIDNIKRYQKKNFKAWIFLIARNKVLDYIRSKKNKFETNILSIDKERDDENKYSYLDIIKEDSDPQKELIKKLEKEKQACVVESVKSAFDIYSPISGEVVEVNDELSNDPAKINQDPYGDGWIFKIKISNPSEIDELMNYLQYEEFIKTQHH